MDLNEILTETRTADLRVHARSLTLTNRVRENFIIILYLLFHVSSVQYVNFITPIPYTEKGSNGVEMRA